MEEISVIMKSTMLISEKCNFQPYSFNGISKLELDGDIFYLVKGEVLIYHEDMILGVLSAPYILGIPNAFLEANFALKISPVGSCVLMKCSKLDFILGCRSVDVSNAAACLLSRNVYYLLKMVDMFKRKKSYSRVVFGLVYYYSQSSNLKEFVTLPKFITHFTGVSRSRVMLFLKELRLGGYLSRKQSGGIRKRIPRRF